MHKFTTIAASAALAFAALPMISESGNEYLHVAASVRYYAGDGDKLRFKGKPASNVASNYVDTGTLAADQARSMHFLDLALDTVRLMLKPGAHFVAKMFQGQGSDEYVKDLRKHFGKVSIRKPKASRPESREVYIVAKEFKG